MSSLEKKKPTNIIQLYKYQIAYLNICTVTFRLFIEPENRFIPERSRNGHLEADLVGSDWD